MPNALVTGTSTGIGQAIAIALAREGYDLALTEIDLSQMKETLAHPDIAKRRVVPIELDLRSRQSIATAFADTGARLGDVDVLINNAGRALVKAAVDVTDADWDDVINTNLKGAFFLSQLFGRACINDKRPGCIVSMASTHGVIGIAERSIYGISKAGIIQMTRMLAVEWADKGIRVNAVAPATVMTPSRQKMLSDPAVRAGMLARIPIGASSRGGGCRRSGLSGEPRRGGGDRTYVDGRRRGDGDLSSLTLHQHNAALRASVTSTRSPATTPLGSATARNSTPPTITTYSSSTPRNDAARTSPICAPEAGTAPLASLRIVTCSLRTQASTGVPARIGVMSPTSPRKVSASDSATSA